MLDRISTLPSTRAVCDQLLAGPVPTVVGVRRTPVGWRVVPDPSLDSLEALFGRRLPRSWWGVALATTGRARHPAEPTAAAWPVRLALVVGRDGTIESAVLGPDGVARTGADDTPPDGLVVDLARRALGMSTTPEAANPIEQVLSGWAFELLHAVLATANPELLDDVEAVEALWPLPGREPGDVPATWVDLHEELLDEGLGWWELTAAEVEWFDAGSFARYVTAHQPSLPAVLEDVRHLRATFRTQSVLPRVDLVAGSVRAEPGEVG